MNCKKGLLILILLLGSMLLVSCGTDRDDSEIGGIFDDIIDIGRLEFLGFYDDNALVGFMRILVGILVFAVLFELARLVGMSRNIGITVAIIFAIMSVIFIPGSILAGIGAAYATLVAFVLIGIPVLGGGYALYRIPSSNRGLIFLKMGIIVLLLWILIAVRGQATELLNASGTGIWGTITNIFR